MKKRIITVLLTIAMLIPFTANAAYAGSDLQTGKNVQVTDPLWDKAVYYTEESDYIDGDCILTATRMMIKRAAIMHDIDGWEEISNSSLREQATVDGLLLYSFSYATGGTVYEVRCGSFTGEGGAARVSEFESLLNQHPEGIVVWGEGAASTGTHGVLVTDVLNGEIYAMDSSYNMGIFSEGIQKWTDTTMLDPSLCTDYWYISEVTREGAFDSEPQDTKPKDAFHINILRLNITTI